MATGDGAPSIYREVQPSAGESGLVALVGVVEVAVVVDQTLGMGMEVLGRDQYPDPHIKSSGGTSSSLKLFFSFDSKGLRRMRRKSPIENRSRSVRGGKRVSVEATENGFTACQKLSLY